MPAEADVRATYRIQFGPHCSFEDAVEIADYLAELGVSDAYLSPVLEAAPGSTHGYDVADPSRVSHGLGGEDGLRSLFDALAEHRLHAVLDIVPNHMAAVPENPWWRDVLARGQESPFAKFFDIDWSPPDSELNGRVLLPILGDHLGAVLARGELKVERGEREGDSPCLVYYEHRLPIAAESAAHAEKLARAGEPADAELLDAQRYLLAHWHIGAEELNYRRFFDINSLIGVRVELPDVFAASHAKILELLRTSNGRLRGLRVDHPDGLRDPKGYFETLRHEAPEAWIVAEKILEPGEELPEIWPVDGTTGYDFMNRAGGLFIAPSGENTITGFYDEFAGEHAAYRSLVLEKKAFIIRDRFGGEVRRLTERLRAACRARNLDFTRRQLREALSELLTAFPVYRAYVCPERGEISEADVQCIESAVAQVRLRRPDIDSALVTFIADLLALRAEAPSHDARMADAAFVLRFQQVTGPTMAKGVEDTAFYCYDRLVTLNEVGGDPGTFGHSPDQFHQECTAMQRRWPRTMLATSTHDTKRSEDVRARIALLSEIPQQWTDAVRAWSEHNAAAWKGRRPDRNAEYLLYQTLVGAWPIETERVRAYMEKAGREAKMYTSWRAPEPEYELRIAEFTEAILGDDAFREKLEEFVAPLVEPGRINSLSMALLKLAVPGVPDIYQGTEVWDNSLVDPDNRRPVNYDRLRGLLEDARTCTAADAMARSDDGLPKIFLVRRALALRAELPGAFGPGSTYAPVPVSGEKLGHLVTFQRGDGVIAAAPRLVISLQDDWADTAVALPEGDWVDVFTGAAFSGSVHAADLLAAFPVALLRRAPSASS